jgi:hypothetical protein
MNLSLLRKEKLVSKNEENRKNSLSGDVWRDKIKYLGYKNKGGKRYTVSI